MFSSIRAPKRLTSLIVVGIIALSTGIVSAADTSGAITVTEVEITNPSTTQTNIALPLPLSTQAFIDGGYVNSTVLNSAVQESATDLPYMPGSKLLSIKKAVTYLSASYSDVTTGINDTVTSVNLPTALDETLEMGLQYRSKIIKMNITTAGVGTYDLTWEYHNGTGWVALQNVIDNTNGFKSEGITTVSYDIPSDWSYYNHPVHLSQAFWIRARISAFTSQTTNPIAIQGSHETGQWWTFHTSVEQDVLKTAKLYFGGPDMQTYFSYFPGSAGIITPDNSTIEPGKQFKYNIAGYFNLSTSAASKDIISKSGAIRLYQSGINQLTFEMTGIGKKNIVENTNDSYMENLEVIYPRARDEDNAGAVYNSSTTIKVGQSYDKDTVTTPSFGAKLNDPS